MSRMQQVIDALEAERAEVKERLEWLEKQLASFRQRHSADRGASSTTRATRRSTARRASTRRATARSSQGDTRTKVIDYLRAHQGSTAGDVAKALNMNRNSVATRLAQLAKAGEITKAKRGYSAKS
jgi:predicted transcriptional regulator